MLFIALVLTYKLMSRKWLAIKYKVLIGTNIDLVFISSLLMSQNLLYAFSTL